MKCLNCGAEIDATSKFCGYCGSSVENQVPPTNEENKNVEQSEITSSIEQETENFNRNDITVEESNINSIESDVNVNQPEAVNPFNSNIEVEQLQAQPESVQNSQNLNTQNTKKKSNSILFILGGVILAVIAAILLILAFNKNRGSIEALEKAINNTISGGVNSGTITASIMVENNGTSMNFSGTAKYQKMNDAYNLQLTLDKSIMFDEMNVYASIDKKSATLYAKTSLIDMMSGTYSEDDSWGYYKLDLSEITSELESNVKLNKEIKLTELGIDKKIKYAGKSGGASHYVLTIDKELFNILESKMTSEEIGATNEILDSMQETNDLIDKGYEIDFYVKNDKLEKISIDLSKFMDESGVSKALFTIEFKDFNNTVVNIPSEVKNGINLETYIESNINTNYNYYDYDFDYDDLSDTDSFDFNIQ